MEGAAREPKSFPASSCNSAEAFATSNYELPCNRTCVHLHLYIHRVILNWSKRFDAFTERQKTVATSSKKQNKTKKNNHDNKVGWVWVVVFKPCWLKTGLGLLRRIQRASQRNPGTLRTKCNLFSFCLSFWTSPRLNKGKGWLFLSGFILLFKAAQPKHSLILAYEAKPNEFCFVTSHRPQTWNKSAHMIPTTKTVNASHSARRLPPGLPRALSATLSSSEWTINDTVRLHISDRAVGLQLAFSDIWLFLHR